jgi:putative aminopeptidase FrvX
MNLHLDETITLLVRLLNTPSPTGYAFDAINASREAFEALGFPGLTTRLLPKGALVITVPGERDDRPIGLAAHADTLGLMVKEIKPSGALKVTNIGGIQWGGVEYENVTVQAANGSRYRGTVIPLNPSGHVNPNLQTQARNADMMEVRLDARVRNAADTRGLGIEVGDFVFVDSRVEQTDTGFIRGRHLDNKAGIACIYGALLALKDAGQIPTQTTTILISNYEETGHGGAAGLPKTLTELLTIDMGALGDGQNGDEYSVSLCVKDSGGPYHWQMNQKLRRLAAVHGIALKPDVYPTYSSDGTIYWRSGGEGRVGLIGPGIASSHGYERTHRDSLAHTTHLIARYLVEPVEA